MPIRFPNFQYFNTTLKYPTQIPHFHFIPHLLSFFLRIYTDAPSFLFSLSNSSKSRQKILITINMAQKTEKEETEFKVPENLPICTLPQTIPASPPQIPVARSPETSDPKVSSACDIRTSSASSPEKPDLMENRTSLKRPREVTRCSGSGCRKRIGLMGFRCRCGDMFCSEHRYSDRHDCSYDYKAAGREAIERENPVVRAAKLLKV